MHLAANCVVQLAAGFVGLAFVVVYVVCSGFIRAFSMKTQQNAFCNWKQL